MVASFSRTEGKKRVLLNAKKMFAAAGSRQRAIKTFYLAAYQLLMVLERRYYLLFINICTFYVTAMNPSTSKQHYVLIEHPGVVKSRQNVIETLGGSKAINDVRFLSINDCMDCLFLILGARRPSTTRSALSTKLRLSEQRCRRQSADG